MWPRFPYEEGNVSSKWSKINTVRHCRHQRLCCRCVCVCVSKKKQGTYFFFLMFMLSHTNDPKEASYYSCLRKTREYTIQQKKWLKMYIQKTQREWIVPHTMARMIINKKSISKTILLKNIRTGKRRSLLWNIICFSVHNQSTSSSFLLSFVAAYLFNLESILLRGKLFGSQTQRLQ